MKILKTQSMLSVIAIMMASLVLSSCDNEESNAAKYEDYFVLGSEKISLASSCILFYDQTPGTNGQTGATYYRNELAFINSDISVDQSGDFAKLSGIGNIIDFEFISPGQQFDIGVYSFTGDDADLTPFNIYGGAVYINYNVEDGTGEVYVFTSGTMTVVEDEKFGLSVKLDGKVYPALKNIDGNVTGPDLSKTAVSVSAKFTGDTSDFEREG